MFWYLIQSLASKQNKLLGRVAAGINLKLDTRNKLRVHLRETLPHGKQNKAEIWKAFDALTGREGGICFFV